MNEKWKDYLFDYMDAYEYMGRLSKGLPPVIINLFTLAIIHVIRGDYLYC